MRRRAAGCVVMAVAALACVAAATAPTVALFSAQRSATASLKAADVFPPVNAVLPVVTGLALQGSTLSTSTGEWVSTATVTYSYQWERCTGALGTGCTAISGATGASYVPVSADATFHLRSRVRAGNSGGSAAVDSLTTLQVP